MFLREIKVHNATYLFIMENYRKNGKMKQKYIASLGRLDDEKRRKQLEQIAVKLLKYYRKNKMLFDISTAEEKERKIWGPVTVYRKIWNMLGCDEMFKKIIALRKIEFDFFSVLFLMLLDRLIDPKSKLKSYEEQDRYYGIKRNELQHLYRALDLLSDNKEKIEKELFCKNVNIFNMKVDIVLYDVTTLYFESIKADSLKDFGFSKDCKINNVQILLGLLVDLEGRPVGFDIFPGNTFEGDTLETAIEKVKQKFNIRRLIFIADQGMLSNKNIKIIKDCKDCTYEYIVGSRIKNKAKKVKEDILDIDKYTVIEGGNEEVFKYREINLNGERVICTWSSKRAHKDMKDRERLLIRAKEILEKGKAQAISKRGASRYIQVEMKGEPALDKKRISNDERWDGFYGIQTNCKDISPQTLLGYYHDLWKIEEAFRIFKSHLEIRPIYHWTARRIKGHLVLCFIAFLLERTLEIELKKRDAEYSSEGIRKALNDLQFSEVVIEGKHFYLRSKVEGLGNEILRALSIRIPPQISDRIAF